MRVLVVGLGKMGRFHVRCLPLAFERLHPSPRPVTSEMFVGAVETGGHGHYDSLDDALKLRWDAAIVAVPIPDLAPVALELIASGIPTLIEKPGAETEEAALEVASAAELCGVMVGVGWIERHNLAALMLSKTLSLVGHVERIESLRVGPTGGQPAHIDLAVHDLDLAVAMGLTDAPHDCVARFEPHRKERRFIVHGSDGALEADLRREELYLWHAGEQSRLALEKCSADALTRELIMFLAAVESRSPFAASIAAAAPVIRAAHEMAIA